MTRIVIPSPRGAARVSFLNLVGAKWPEFTIIVISFHFLRLFGGDWQVIWTHLVNVLGIFDLLNQLHYLRILIVFQAAIRRLIGRHYWRFIHFFEYIPAVFGGAALAGHGDVGLDDVPVVDWLGCFRYLEVGWTFVDGLLWLDRIFFDRGNGSKLVVYEVFDFV